MTPAACGSVAPSALPAPCCRPAHVVGKEHGQAARTNCPNSWEIIILLLRAVWVLLIRNRGTTVPGDRPGLGWPATAGAARVQTCGRFSVSEGSVKRFAGCSGRAQPGARYERVETQPHAGRPPNPAAAGRSRALRRAQSSRTRHPERSPSLSQAPARVRPC